VLTILVRGAGWLGINSVLGIMYALLISFYSPEPFLDVLISAQITTHVLCILIEVTMFTVGLHLYRLGERKKMPGMFFLVALFATVLAALAGVFLGGEIHARLLGFRPYQSSRFYNAVFGSIIVAITLTSVERLFRHLNETRMRAEQALQETRLQVLQERMRPHFLFNALNTIHSLLQTSPAQADLALLGLADSYRFLLGAAEKTLVTFAEEWGFCKHYVEFMKIRFGARLTVTMEQTGDLSLVQIPPISIQPLIENAFRHGIQKIPGKGSVAIHAWIGDDTVEITVSDSGPGGIFEGEEARTLANIRQRLAFYYQRAHVELVNRDEGGALARLRFRLGK